MNNETMNYHQDFEGRQNEKFMEKPINPLPKTKKKLNVSESIKGI